MDFNKKIKKPKILKISPSGELKLKFSKDRIKEGNCRRLQENVEGQAGETLIVDGVERVIGQLYDGEPIRGLGVYLEASEMSDTEKLKFLYKVVKIVEDGIDLILLFDNPGEVSANIEKEKLIVYLKNFRDDENLLKIGRASCRERV